MAAWNAFDPVAIAIEICNNDAFKLEIFSGIYSEQDTPENCKKIWDEKVETVTASLLEDYHNLEKNEQEAVTGAVFTIAFKMLTWIEFYMGTFGFTRDFCIGFLDPALFTREGVIDSQRVEAKMAVTQLTNLQRFLLACFYCQAMGIPRLFNNLTTAEKNLVYNANEPELIRQPDIIKFWSYHVRGELDKLKGDDRIDQFRLKTAITSGSRLAVNFCIERTRLRQNCLIDIAVGIFRHRIHREIKSNEKMNTVDDWVVFRHKKYNCAEESWVPDNFFADIFYSVISAMSQPQKDDFWRHIFSTKFILSDERIKHVLFVDVLECFVCWPYQEMFRKFWQSSWPRLSGTVFFQLFLNIRNRIELERGNFWYGEEKFYNYRKFLIDLWIDIPKSVKIHLSSKYSKYILELFKSLYNLKTFSEVDREIIKTIIETATEKEGVGFPHILSDNGYKLATMLLERRRLDLFEELVSACFVNPTHVQYFTLEIILRKSRKDCMEFVKNKKWLEAEEILKWSDYELSPDEMLALKNSLISCETGIESCIEFWKSDPDLADQFICWCLPPEKVLRFKCDIISGEIGRKKIREFCISNTEIADNFLRWCLPLEFHKDYKSVLIHKVESICMCTKYALIDNTPELADKLMQWCLPEEEIKEYKKWLGHCKIEVFPVFQPTYDGVENCTDDEFPDKIFNWEPAKKMFSWCFGLSHKEEMIMASVSEEKSIASDPEGVKKISTELEGIKIIASDSGGEKSQDTDSGGEKSQNSDSKVEKIPASDSEGEKIPASDSEGEKIPASDSEGEKIPAYDIAESMIIASDVESKKEIETIASGSEGEINRIPDNKSKKNVVIDPEEELKFKRTYLHKFRREIIYKCLESNNYKVADKFLSWLNLDKIGLRAVKTEQICSDTETGELLSAFLCMKDDDPKFAETGGKQRTIERFIHWFLVDNEISIIQVFMKRLNRYSDNKIVQSIISKLEQSDDIEEIKELLMTF